MNTIERQLTRITMIAAVLAAALTVQPTQAAGAEVQVVPVVQLPRVVVTAQRVRTVQLERVVVIGKRLAPAAPVFAQQPGTRAPRG